MRIFEPHAHMTSRTTDDYEAMAASGVKALVEPAFWLGQPRTSVGSFVDYFNSLLGWERFRAAQFGIRHHCTIGLNPKEANDDALRREVLAILPRYLAKDGVVAVGEIGFDAMTAAEEEALARSSRWRASTSCRCSSTRRTATRRRARAARSSSSSSPALPRARPDRPQQRADRRGRARHGCWAGFSIYPNTKMDEYRMVRILEEHGTERMLVNSACDWGVSDPLKVSKTVAAMREAGFDDDDIDQVVWRNPVEFFGQSGRLILDDLGERDLTATFEGNTVLRGERGRDEAPPPRRQRPPPRVLLQRPPGRRPRRRRRAARALRRAGARAPRTCRCWASGCGSRRRRPADAAAAERLAARLDALGLEVVTLNGFPYRAFHAPVVKRDVYRPTGRTTERSAYTLGLARLLAAAAAGRRGRGQHLDPAARLARRAGTRTRRRRRAAALESVAEGLERLEAETGRRIRVALEPEPGCDRDGRQAAEFLAGLAPEWIGPAWTPATSRSSSRMPTARWRALDDAGVRSSRRRCRARCASPEPGVRGRPRRCSALRRAAVPAPGARARRRARRRRRRSPGGARRRPARASASGASTSTFRCTRASTRRRTSWPHARRARRRARRRSPATSRWRPTPGRVLRGRAAPTTTRSWTASRASWPGRATASSHSGAEESDDARRHRRRRAHAARAGAHAAAVAARRQRLPGAPRPGAARGHVLGAVDASLPA